MIDEIDETAREQIQNFLNHPAFANTYIAVMPDVHVGIYTSTASKETLDEAPGAYKDMKLILDNIKETVEVIEMIKPVYNFKAGKE